MTLEAQGVVAGYTKELPILRGVDLAAAQGRVTVIIGPNGAGKSIKGLEPKDMLREGIAYLLQGHSVFPRMTVDENLELGAWILRGDHEAMERAFEEAYGRFPSLRERRSLPAGVLSGGEQRMLEIARLTMTGPKTLLLDEPSVGLMPKLVDSIYDQIVKLKEEGRFTIVIVDQNVKKSIAIADYVYVLRLGENSHHGPQAEFRERLEDIIKEWI